MNLPPELEDRAPSEEAHARVAELAKKFAASENPLLDIFVKLHPGYLLGMDWYRQKGAYGARYARAEELRVLLCRRYSWSIPWDPALKLLKRLGPLVEIGAGTGYWAKLLRARGVDHVAYDTQPPTAKSKQNEFHPNAERFSEVEVGGPEKISLHPDRALFLYWPPPDEPMATECLKNFQGKKLAFIGDGQSVADEEFNELVRRHFDVMHALTMPQWMGSGDQLTIYRRRKKPRPPLPHSSEYTGED